jgi:hypothetical protein
MDEQMTLPRDAYSTALRKLDGHPDAVKAESRLDIVDDYGRSETWTIDTYRVDGQQTCLMQRVTAEGALRLVLPPQVTRTLARQHESLTQQNRRKAARLVLATRLLRGDRLGNPEALARARKAKAKK